MNSRSCSRSASDVGLGAKSTAYTSHGCGLASQAEALCRRARTRRLRPLWRTPSGYAGEARLRGRRSTVPGMGAETLSGIAQERVDEWLAEHVPDVEPPFRYALIAGGHSNLTFEVVDARGRRFVLRRPPLGGVLQSAHDMGREHRIISALAPTRVPVPQPLGSCEDPEVNGAPFYVMEFVEGMVFAEAADVGPGFGEG